MKRNFDIYLKDENMKHIVDESDTVQRYNKDDNYCKICGTKIEKGDNCE